MNFMRPVFISLFAMLLVLLSLYAGAQIWHNTTLWISWLGLLLAAFAPLVFLTTKQLHTSRKEAIQPIGFSTVCGLGVAITMTASWKYGSAAGVVHVWAGACLIGWLIYLKWR
jgi:hypothetical protein